MVPKPLRNGTWKGDSKVNEFGTVQLSIVVSGGKITNVKVLAYPNDRTQSKEINNAALPKLRSRALAAPEFGHRHGHRGDGDERKLSPVAASRHRPRPGYQLNSGPRTVPDGSTLRPL